jgi:signal peptidase II
VTDASAPTLPPPGSTADDAQPEQRALHYLPAHLRLWLVLAIGLVIDLWSKAWAFHTLRQGGHRVLIPHVLELHITMNPGALFGIGAGHTEVFLFASVLALVLVLWMFAHSAPRAWIVHIALGAILAGALGNMYDRAFVQLVRAPVPTDAGIVLQHVIIEDAGDPAFVLLREYPPDERSAARPVAREDIEQLGPARGYVRDFIKIPTRWFGDRQLWPWVFNVADMLLVGGVAVLAIRMLRERPREQVAVESDPRPATSAAADPEGATDAAAAGPAAGATDAPEHDSQP